MERYRNIYKFPDVGGIMFDSKDPNSISMTKQSFAKDADINYIMDKFQKTGVLGEPQLGSGRMPIWGDFSDVRDFKAQMVLITKINDAFDQLPVNVKIKFNHDPQALLDFLADPANDKEAIALGLREAPALDPLPPKVEAAPAAPAAPAA